MKMTDAWVTFYSPRHTDKGKNENDSWLDITVTIKTSDGTVYRGETKVIDHSLIDPGQSISPHVPIKDADKIEFSDVVEVTFYVGFIKKDWLPDLRMDEFAVRSEFVMKFGDQEPFQYLSTGYNDPPEVLNFTDRRHVWEPKPNPRYRAQLNEFITITEAAKD